MDCDHGEYLKRDLVHSAWGESMNRVKHRVRDRVWGWTWVMAMGVAFLNGWNGVRARVWVRIWWEVRSEL